MVVMTASVSGQFPPELALLLASDGFDVQADGWEFPRNMDVYEPLCLHVGTLDVKKMEKMKKEATLHCTGVFLVLDENDSETLQTAWRLGPADVLPAGSWHELPERLRQWQQSDARDCYPEKWWAKALPQAHAALWSYSIATDKMLSHGLRALLNDTAQADPLTLKQWLEHVLEEQQPMVQNRLDSLVSGSAQQVEFEHKSLATDGQILWLHNRVEVEPDAEGNPLRLRGVTLDVTDFKMTQAMMLDNQARFRHLFQTMSSGVSVLEAVDTTPRLLFKDCNRSAARLHKMAAESMIGMELLPHSTCITNEELVSLCVEVWRKNLPKHYHSQIYANDVLDKWISHYIYKLPSGEIVIVHDDITGQKKAEIELERQLHFLQELIDAIPNPVFYKDAQRIYRFCNKAFIDFVGCSRDEVVGHGVFDVYSAEDAAYYYDQNTVVLEKGEPIHFERRTSEEGESRLLLFYEAPYIDHNKQLLGIVGSIIDITERKRVEEYKLETEKLAERSLRLASLGTLAGGIAHEINQPLTVIKAEVDGIRIRKELEQEIEEAELLETMQVIGEEVTRIHDIVDHMRSLIRGKTSGDMQAVEITEIVRRGLQMVGQQVTNHGIQMKLELAEDLPSFRGYPLNVEQILINLMVNAMQALDSVQQPEKHILVRTGCQDDWLELEVADNGPGIPPDRLRNVFDPFFTTKFDQKGLGLGLAIVENYTQAMNGTVHARNMPGGGTSFLVRLPVASCEGVFA